MKRILVVGGANGIGLAIATELASRATTEIVYVVDKRELGTSYRNQKIKSFVFDLTSADYSFVSRLLILRSFFRHRWHDDYCRFRAFVIVP